jgi:glycosyltransferase involved in cell wall biosynthesis
MTTESLPRIAVLVPCHNEALTVAGVVQGFAASLPGAAIYVCDNGSADNTADIARAAGARVISEPRLGKGNAVRRLFADVDADIYILVDGDATYDAGAAPAMVETLLGGGLDMVNGRRIEQHAQAYRPGHRLGNLLLSSCVKIIFGAHIEDLLSGYRVFSRRFVKSFPAFASGFEIETEITVHALEMRMPMAEMETRYFERPPGSSSKLRTIHDGLRILRTIAILVRDERPLAFFAAIGLIMLMLGVVLAVPLFITYMQTGLVPRLPTGVVAVGLVLLSFLSIACGLILDMVTLSRREMKRLFYMAIPMLGKSG